MDTHLRIVKLASLLAGSFLIASPSAVTAKDLQTLIKFVAPAYTGMNFAAVCARDNPQFLTQTGGPRGTAFHYAEHVKDEAIASLTYDEATTVLRAAADAARQKAKSKIDDLVIPADDKATMRAISGWCGGDAKLFVMHFIKQHDSDHAAVAELLRQAKK